MSAIDPSLPLLHLMCAADRNYGAYAGLVMQSAMAVARRSRIHFHLLSDNVAPDDIAKCRAAASRGGHEFTSYEVSSKLDNLPKELRMANHLSRAAYSRLLFSDLLPENIQRIIYLDCDIICKQDIAELWDFGDTLKTIAAVRDPWLDPDTELKSSLGLAPHNVYFNSGVLLINVDAWRAEHTEDRLRDFVLTRRDIKHADQDTLNAVLSKDLMELPEKWNMMINHPRREDENRLRETAGILHYVGGFKPWHFGYGLLYPTKGQPYASIKRRSPWASKLPDFQSRRVTKKFRSLVRQ
ncbi:MULTISPECIES: glycosyltransferase family 8 protein [unclassified Methylobacterium]|jgi:lipopolysaccharide biosynthesis glycosyltransferase|uniref:glycosyltransferase family 8 protein n=1 Tax=unclassified Methylobacterium TaxID=2615210 RepID=UPI001355E90A|nr:glycosyltransferase family 8 protein [Methylobacterium sp. 2A]MWV21035.1 glycosyltransferase family 8 protein [Methylobacterium sp. 2A]